jgi:hypothetical protein
MPEQLLNSLWVLLLALVVAVVARTVDWKGILAVFCAGTMVMAVGFLVALAFDDLQYFPRWLLLYDGGPNASRAIQLAYGLIVASILLALRRLLSRLLSGGGPH